MKIAIVHDYLIDFGGAEQVLLTLHEIYPKAPVYTLIVDKRGMGKMWQKFEGVQINTSWFGKIPFASKLISPLRFLIPIIWNSFNFEKYDLVISSASWAITKGFSNGKTKEICYLHTPPRYLYGYDTSRNWKGKWFSKLVEFYALIVNHFMRMYDFKRAQKVNYFIANSENVGQRIVKFYRRDYKVIYPPVDVEEIIKNNVETMKQNYFLTGGRLVASKNFDLIIKSCLKAGVSLKVYGSGIDGKRLKEIGKNNVEFLGRVDREELIGQFKNAKGFIVAQQDEDFGITPVEAMAAGTPVIAYRGGGYLETVVDGKTGIFFDELTIDSLVGAINKFNRLKFNGADCITQSKKFSKERFINEITSFINKHA